MNLRATLALAPLALSGLVTASPASADLVAPSVVLIAPRPVITAAPPVAKPVAKKPTRTVTATPVTPEPETEPNSPAPCVVKEWPGDVDPVWDDETGWGLCQPICVTEEQVDCQVPPWMWTEVPETEPDFTEAELIEEPTPVAEETTETE